MGDMEEGLGLRGCVRDGRGRLDTGDAPGGGWPSAYMMTSQGGTCRHRCSTGRRSCAPAHMAPQRPRCGLSPCSSALSSTRAQPCMPLWVSRARSPLQGMHGMAAPAAGRLDAAPQSVYPGICISAALQTGRHAPKRRCPARQQSSVTLVQKIVAVAALMHGYAQEVVA